MPIPVNFKQRMDEQNMDAQTQIFFEEELRAIEREVEQIDFPEMLGRTLFPVDFNYPAGTSTITYYTVEKVGMAQWLANGADDLPRATIKRTRNSSDVRTMAISYGWTLDDIEAAQMAGIPLDRDEAEAAKEAISRFENNVIWNGDADYNINGILDNTNIPTAVVTADGVAGATTFASKTPARIVRDIGLLLSTIRINTKNIEKGNTILMPIGQYELIVRTPFNDFTSTTILQFVLATHPGLQIFSVLEMDSAENSIYGNDIMMAYDRNPRKVKLVIPVDFEQRPVQVKNFQFEIPTREKFGGAIVKKPLSFNIGEGI